MDAVRGSAPRAGLPWLALGLWLVATPCTAQKTDIVTLVNGDRITCEIKGLQRGYLQASTDAMSSVDIVWADVAQIASTHRFAVEIGSGDEYIGTLRSPENGKLEIVRSDGGPPVVVPLAIVVGVRPARSRFLSRLDGSLALGFNLARANKQRDWSLNLNAAYSGIRWFGLTSAASSFSSQEDVESTSRNDFSLQGGRLLRNRWFYAGLAEVSQNEELGLILRVAFGGGVGRRLVASNRRALSVMGGLLVSREKFQDVEGAETNLEGLMLARYDGFRRVSPKLDTMISFSLLPSITDAGRVRGEFKLSLSVEVFHNFFAGFNGFDSFDSRPPDSDLTKNDYGLATSVSWKF